MVDKKGVFHRSPLLGSVTIPLDNPGLSQVPNLRPNSWTKYRQRFPPCYSQSHLKLYLWDYCFFKLTQPPSVSTVHYKGERRKPDRNPYLLPFGLRNSYRNIKSQNSQDYTQKPQRNCTFMNSASVQTCCGVQAYFLGYLFNFSCLQQCWGSGSGIGSGFAGSACFWASRIRIQYSELWIRIRILLFSHKCVERTEIIPAKYKFFQWIFQL